MRTLALLLIIAAIAAIDYASGMAVVISVLYFIPDRYGHAAGDDLLRRVGATLGSVLRAGNIAAKNGGKGRAAAELA